MKSLAGLAGYLHSVDVDWTLALAVTAAAVAGSVLGGGLAGRVAQETLRRAFGWFVAVMAGFVLLQQAPPAAREWLARTPYGWAALAALGVASAAAAARRRRRPARHSVRGGLS